MFESSAGGGWLEVGGAGRGLVRTGRGRRNSAAPQLIVSKSPARRGPTFTTLLLEAFFSASAIFLPDACLPHPRTRRFDRVSEFLLCREKENIIVAGLNEKDQTGFLRQQPKLKVSFNNEC